MFLPLGLYVGVSLVDFGLLLGQLGPSLLDFVLKLTASGLQVRKLLFSLFDGLDIAVDIVFLCFETGYLRFDFLKVDRAHDEVSKVLRGHHCPAGFVRLEQEREQVCEFRVVEIRVATERCRPVPSFEVASVRRVPNCQRHFCLVGVPFHRDVFATECSHNRLQERRSVRRVSACKDVHTGVQSDSRIVDTTDVSHRDNGVFLKGIRFRHTV